MLKSVKIPEKAYKTAKLLSKKLREKGEFKGMYDVPLSTTISYALEKTFEDLERKESFRRAAGSWKDINTDRLIKEIYEDRKKGTKWDPIRMD